MRTGGRQSQGQPGRPIYEHVFGDIMTFIEPEHRDIIHRMTPHACADNDVKEMAYREMKDYLKQSRIDK
eukprot:4421263-Pyramimonas_sp.AAC.1